MTVDNLTGAGHYGEAERLLGEARARRGTLKPYQLQVIIAEAQVHATLALTAATALPTTVKFVGDSQEITDWSRAIQPTATTSPAPWSALPENWPPKHGDVWQDRHRDRWSCQSDGTLACLARKADDSPSEIQVVFGPLILVYRPYPTEEEAPF
jgi:hypothetical protein